MQKKDQGKDEETEIVKSTRREYFESVCVAVILALFIRTFVVQAFKIPTSSMEQNLLVGDHLLVNKMLYSPAPSSLEQAITPIRDVRRQDIVVFKYPDDPERDFIKRVIALPLESIRIENKQIFINGEPLDETYTHFSEPPRDSNMGGVLRGGRDSFQERIVPEGEYFVMGDNRDNSSDSRFWGTLPRALVKGRALIVYWSYEADKDAYLATGFMDRMKELFNVARYFFTKTRWKRFFHLVR